MRTRFCATMRRPACSIMALIAPVRLRAVASGLMIEKVRSIAIVWVPLGMGADARQMMRALIAATVRSIKVAPRRQSAAAAGPRASDCAFSLAKFP